MPIDLVLATRNEKKLAEMKDILADMDFNIRSVRDFPCVPEIEEVGITFEANATAKAVQVANSAMRLALADDSGLEIDFLEGFPGVRSARFAGEDATDEVRNRKVLDLLEGVPQSERKARFRCAIAVAAPDGQVEVVAGACEGEIALEPRGNTGFGYDPIFIVPAYGKTFAELGQEKKNQISHRANALKKARDLLRHRQT